jgi:hypothetical protein
MALSMGVSMGPIAAGAIVGFLWAWWKARRG